MEFAQTTTTAQTTPQASAITLPSISLTELRTRQADLKARMAEDDPWHLGSAVVFEKWDKEETEGEFLDMQDLIWKAYGQAKAKNAPRGTTMWDWK